MNTIGPDPSLINFNTIGPDPSLINFNTIGSDIQLQNKPRVLRIGEKGVEREIRLAFDNKDIVVVRFGEVWAAIVKASSRTAVNKLNKAKGRKPNQPLSVLCSVEMLQYIADRDHVDPSYLPLLDNVTLLKKAICDKLFLAVPISVQTVLDLSIPISVLSEIRKSNDTDQKLYLIHIISGQGSDYDSVQNTLCPPINFKNLTTKQIRKYIQDNLVAITSWNETGQGSNLDDFNNAYELCQKKGTPIIVQQHINRGSPHGSYGIVDIGIYHKRKRIKRRVTGDDQSHSRYWRSILRNLARCQKLASKAQPQPEITPSGF